jgi:hypothetical protein
VYTASLGSRGDSCFFSCSKNFTDEECEVRTGDDGAGGSVVTLIQIKMNLVTSKLVDLLK